jgi:nucleoside-diphosphate-sugar epimerase
MQGHDVRASDIRKGERSKTYDLTKISDAIHALEGCECVYHLAALMGGAAFNTERRFATAAVNATIDSNVMLAAETVGAKRLVYASSACVYPTMCEDPLAESMALGLALLPGYGDAKWFGERLCALAVEGGQIDARIARIFTVYGPNDHVGYRGKFVASICDKFAVAARDSTPLEIWGDGQQWRSVIYVDDCVDVLVALMGLECNPGPINVSSADTIHPLELVEILSKITQSRVGVTHKADAPTGVKARIADNTYARSVLPHRMYRQLMGGIGETYRWVAQRRFNS